MTTQPFIDPERCDLTSASSWECKHFCAGSDALIATLPADARKSSGEAAESGQRIHKALETGDDSELEMSEGEIKERLSKLEQDAVSSWTESILDPNRTYSPRVIRETRIWVTDGSNNKITSAKVDAAWVSLQHGIVLDYKSGYKLTTPAQRNLQCKVQAVALWQETGVSRIRVVIAQHRFSSMVTQADYTEEDLQRAYQEILYDDWHSKQPDAQRVPGKWCEYCAAKTICVENHTYATMPMAMALPQPPIDLPAKAQKECVALAVAQLTVEQLAFIERRRGIASKLFDAVRDRLKTLTPEQLVSVGFELSEGRNQLEVKSFAGLTEALYQMKDRGELTAEEFAGAFEFSIGAVEKAVLPRRIAKAEALMLPKLTAKAAKEGLRAELSPFVSFDDPKNRTDKILNEKQ